jgi:hypothetical protein
MSKRYQGGILGVGFNPLRAPNAPTVGTATGGCSSATVAFTAPACVGGSAVTGYTAQSNPGGFSGAAVGSPITVSGLSNGTAYTFGVFALNNYGPSPISAFSNSVTPALPDGTFAIFALGYTGSGSTTRNKYTYSGDVVGTGGAATAGSYEGSATGNGTVGIFTLGITTTPTTTRDKYTYVGCVVSSATAATTASYGGSAVGNSTVGIIALGTRCVSCMITPVTTRNKYTYSSDVVTTGGVATTASYYGSAAGNSTVGIFALGNVSFAGSTTRNKYTYSGDTVSAGGAATAASRAGSAAGNSTFGVFALGCTTVAVVTRDKYTYSGCVVASATAATVASRRGSAAGNSTIGIFSLGNSTTTRNKYTYSGCVVSSATAATTNTSFGSAASNGINGITV